MVTQYVFKVHLKVGKHPTLIRKINSAFLQNSNFNFDDQASTYSSLIEADIMISDWSGVAFNLP